MNGNHVNKQSEKEATSEDGQKPFEDNTLIRVLKPIDIMNNDIQHGFNKVHVLCCSKCDFLTISIDSLHQHLKLLHLIPTNVFNELTIYSCQQCQCVSTELKLIKEHIKMFHDLGSNEMLTKLKLEKLLKKSKPMSSVSLRLHRKTVNSKRIKKQLKIRKKLQHGKSNVTIDQTQNPLENQPPKYSPSSNEYEMKQENDVQLFDDKAETKRSMFANTENNENDPLDMSMNSITCPFKGIKPDSIDRSINQIKQDLLLSESFESFMNNNINVMFSNPQTCIELIKLTLGHMFAKSTNDQSRLPLPGFTPSSFLQPQFQLFPNIIPLLLPTLTPVSNSSQIINQPELTFSTQNLEIDTILSNLQQHNVLKTVSSNSYEQPSHLLPTHQQSSLFLNHKSDRSSPNISKNLFIDSIPKNDNGDLSATYKGKKSTDCATKLTQKKQLKKNPIQSRIRNGLSDNINFIPKSEPTTEDLFNRSFLDSSIVLDVKTDQMDLNKILDKHESSCDLFDGHGNASNKSSPDGGLASDKPHRQNFTSQQNRILSDWFFTHCDKPYPSTEDTKELSQLSGLTYSQVKKWFANKRARSSLNKKGLKNYSLITSTEFNMDTMTTNNDLYSDGLLAVSPSSESHKVGNSSLIKSSNSQLESPTNLRDFNQPSEEKS